MSIFVTADHHFGHANIIKFCNRPFKNADGMDKAMIRAWNLTVGHDDTVYHLGDFTLTDSLSPWIHALNFARLYIVPGGHDYRWMATFKQDIDFRIQILDPLITLEIPCNDKYPRVVVLCHYPMLSWDRSHYGSLHLHGHSHCTISGGMSGDTQLPPNQVNGKRVDVGVDCWNFTPINLDNLLWDGEGRKPQ